MFLPPRAALTIRTKAGCFTAAETNGLLRTSVRPSIRLFVRPSVYSSVRLFVRPFFPLFSFSCFYSFYFSPFPVRSFFLSFIEALAREMISLFLRRRCRVLRLMQEGDESLRSRVGGGRGGAGGVAPFFVKMTQIEDLYG